MHALVKIPSSFDEKFQIFEDNILIEGFYLKILKGKRRTLFFAGHLIAENRLIATAKDFDRYLCEAGTTLQILKNADGAFTACFLFEDKIYCVSDVNSLEQAFIASSSGFIYISTSYMLLTERLLEDGVRLQADKALINRFLRFENVYDTLFSNSTVIKEIRLIPYNTAIKIQYIEGVADVSEERLNSLNQLAERNSYEDLLEIAASKIMSKISLASRLSDITLLSLSGGSDSRILYAFSKKLDLDNLYVFTGGKGRDREVAEQLARTGNDTLHSTFPRRKTTSLSPTEALRRYELANLGLYSFLDVSQVNVCDPYEVIELRGGGALREAYPIDGRDLSGLNDLDSSEEASFKQDLPEPFGNFSWRDMHYLAFRNRIHVGRNNTESRRVACRFDPLQTPELQAAASLVTAEQRRDFKIYCDLLMMSSPVYAFIEFDKDYKKFKSNILRDSPFLGAEKNIDFSIIEFSSRARLENSPDWSTVPKRHWMDESGFIAEVDEILIGTIEIYLPEEYRSYRDNAVKNYHSGTGMLNSRGRQLSKLFTLARLHQIGVSFN